MNRFLKYINLLIALVCVAALSVVWWYGYRVLARTSGTVEAGVSAEATAVRDDRGVPHITAATIDDALFVQGYVTAQDRLFQMEIMRRQASGTLAELVGRAALESDLETRRLRLRRVAEQHARSLNAEERSVFAAYARGVNHFIETHMGAYPVEFAVLGSDPAPWSIADSLLVSLTMFRSLTKTWPDELTKRAMLEGGDAEKVRLLFPTRTGLEPQLGSNAWALSGARTASGKPLLATDPHLAFSLPGVWYQVHLKAPSLDVAGVALPGLPGVTIGHNSRIAWGMTNLHFDVQDLYETRLDVARGLYLDGNRPLQARVEREAVRIRGGAIAEIIVTSTHRGPIVATEGGRSYALRWPPYDEGAFHYPVLPLNQAQNWKEFTAALARFPGPAQNFIYADVHGNIGYHVAGRIPIRKNHDGDLPVANTEGEANQWEGYIPFEELPSAYNPAPGAIVSANQNPFPTNYAYRVSGAFAPHYRARQVRNLLDAKPKWIAAEMLAIQKDVYSGFHHYLAQQLAGAARGQAGANPLLSQVAPILDAWNGQMEIGQPAPFLTSLAFQHLRKAIVGRATQGKSAAYESSISYAVVEQLLRSRSKEWFPDWDRTLVQVLTDAAEEGARIQGRDASKWDWGRANQVRVANPILGDIYWLGKYCRIGPTPMSGAPTTVKQMTVRHGPSMRYVADLSDWDRSLMNVSTGQSGQPLSSHYKDQWLSYYVGHSFPMQFSKVEGGDTLQFVPQR